MADFVGENERYLNEEDIQQKRVATGAKRNSLAYFEYAHCKTDIYN